MNQLILSSTNLEKEKPLNNGNIHLSEILIKLDSESIFVTGSPNCDISLLWKEIRTPRIPDSFIDLVGKKFTTYKFQYLGKFIMNGQSIHRSQESYSTSFSDKRIVSNLSESDGWVNCTWFLDFIMNADKINNDTLRSEKLFIDYQSDTIQFTLSNQSFDGNLSEKQMLILSNKEVQSKHQVVFTG